MKKLSFLHKDIENKFLETYSNKQKEDVYREKLVKKMIGYIDKIIEASPPKRIAVIGCGPVPTTIKVLAELGYNPIGYEPVQKYVENANIYLSGNGEVYVGQCELVPAKNESFDIIFCESVLEHVDSPERSLNEFYRILKPGGIVYIATENKRKFSITGKNSEYNLPFYNWYPKSVKEGYINMHLNYKPHLANYTPLPAVHWYTYSSLCRIGRYAGFGKFYSIIDVMDENDSKLKKIFGGKLLLNWAKRNPWLKALLLRQYGSTIFMYKRESFL